MAKSKRKSNGQASSKAASARSQQDAIAVLKSDHREVEGLFKQFEEASSKARKGTIAQEICTALLAHATIEEELFYPAFLEATQEKDLHHEAEIEHAGAKKLIAEIEQSSPADDYYDAKVTVLSEMIKHHVKEEEQPGGMFAIARQSEMDLQGLGRQLMARKREMQGNRASHEGPMLIAAI